MRYYLVRFLSSIFRFFSTLSSFCRFGWFTGSNRTTASFQREPEAKKHRFKMAFTGDMGWFFNILITYCTKMVQKFAGEDWPPVTSAAIGFAHYAAGRVRWPRASCVWCFEMRRGRGGVRSVGAGAQKPHSCALLGLWGLCCLWRCLPCARCAQRSGRAAPMQACTGAVLLACIRRLRGPLLVCAG